jgi:GNAT superfamily N-acetyltransferase
MRPIQATDIPLLREIFVDAIHSQAAQIYSPEQIHAWASLAWLPGILDRTLEEGQGWISGVDDGFAIRHPSNRLSMLYCRGRSSRQGHGSALLQAIESDAQRMGIKRLQTEASLLSRPMLERRGWMVIAPESFTIASVPFLRFKMNKSLC